MLEQKYATCNHAFMLLAQSALPSAWPNICSPAFCMLRTPHIEITMSRVSARRRGRHAFRLPTAHQETAPSNTAFLLACTACTAEQWCVEWELTTDHPCMLVQVRLGAAERPDESEGARSGSGPHHSAAGGWWSAECQPRHSGALTRFKKRTPQNLTPV